LRFSYKYKKLCACCLLSFSLHYIVMQSSWHASCGGCRTSRVQGALRGCVSFAPHKRKSIKLLQHPQNNIKSCILLRRAATTTSDSSLPTFPITFLMLIRNWRPHFCSLHTSSRARFVESLAQQRYYMLVPRVSEWKQNLGARRPSFLPDWLKVISAGHSD